MSAISSHFSYWNSPDTALLLARAVSGLDVLTGRHKHADAEAAAVPGGGGKDGIAGGSGNAGEKTPQGGSPKAVAPQGGSPHSPPPEQVSVSLQSAFVLRGGIAQGQRVLKMHMVRQADAIITNDIAAVARNLLLIAAVLIPGTGGGDQPAGAAQPAGAGGSSVASLGHLRRMLCPAALQ